MNIFYDKKSESSSALQKLGSWNGPRLKWIFVLATLSIVLVDCMRFTVDAQGFIGILMGSAPNFLASFSLPALILVLREKLQGRVISLSTSQWGLLAIVLSQAAILAWELAQIFMHGMYFDWRDIVATLMGGITWAVMCLTFQP